MANIVGPDQTSLGLHCAYAIWSEHLVYKIVGHLRSVFASMETDHVQQEILQYKRFCEWKVKVLMSVQKYGLIWAHML